MSWSGIIAISAVAYLTKLLGIVIPRKWLEQPYIANVAILLPTSLLAALTAVQVFAIESSLTIDARAIGLLIGVIAYKIRAPFIVIVVSAALSAAFARAWFGIN